MNSTNKHQTWADTKKKEKRSGNNWPNQLSVCQCDIAVRTKQKKKQKTEGYFMVISRFYHLEKY